MEKFRTHLLFFVNTVPDENVTEEDVARSLLFTISNDIGQIACLYAMIHKLKKVFQLTLNALNRRVVRSSLWSWAPLWLSDASYGYYSPQVYFGGYFLRNHPLSMHTISYSINYWSRGAVQSLFLRHEGYLGAIGAFLKGAEEWGTYISFELGSSVTWFFIRYPTTVMLTSISIAVLWINAWVSNLPLGLQKCTFFTEICWKIKTSVASFART